MAKYLSADGASNSGVETEALILENFPGGFEHSLVIPVYRESPDILERLKAFCQGQSKLLIVLVLNQPENNHQNQWAHEFYCAQTLTHDQIQWQSADATLSLFSKKTTMPFYW